MTAEEIRRSDKVFLAPRDVCGLLKCDAYTLNVTVKMGRGLPFPHFMSGARLKIPREAFIEWAEKTKLM